MANLLRIFSILAACSLVLLFSPAQSVNAVQSEKSGCESLLVTKCSNCHYLTRICQQLGKKSRGNWRRSVKRMVRKGALLSKEEQQLLVECLHKQEEGVKLACKPYE